ncbi:hypothetical protein EI94DRAFT_1811086 [Lactarius quietus]|nr:hypothetical protein EI94DRAFT_1811086 [Lactarius quietus]
MPRMIGDFDDNANSLWSLHLGEAKSHDEARINSLKDDMDSVLIFAGLFSAALTSFLIDSVNNLRVDPAQQMVYYQQQNVALLAQISEQISFIVPQVTIPSTLPPPYPTFSPKPSDVRVNVYWFMSLVFSLFAALLATLVQQWVRDYMHVFQRYSNPLKGARLRQYLYEGVERWHMPRVARFVPGLVHISLLLFFLGLGDTLLATYTTVGVTTIIPIAICGFPYVLSIFAPVINPQYPFRNPFTSLIWYLKQKADPRRYLDRASGGSLKAVSSNLSEGQMQLAMEEGDGRKDRDVRAIRWLIHNRTEDDEMESFVMAIPGAFTSKWGIDVWRKASEVKQYEDADFRPNYPTVRSQNDADLPMSVLPHHHSSPSRTRYLPGLIHLERIFGTQIATGNPRDVTATRLIPRLPSDSLAPIDPYADLAVHDLCKRVRHLVATCDNPSVFTNKELWLKRARGCVETAASLVCCADIEPALLGDLKNIIISLRNAVYATVSQAGHFLVPGSDGLFSVRMDCLSFVIINQAMRNHNTIKLDAHAAIEALSRFGTEDDSGPSNGDDNDNNETALRNAQKIDDYFEKARQFCVYRLRGAFRPKAVETTEEQVRELLERDHEDDISMLEHIAPTTDRVVEIDKAISKICDSIFGFANGLMAQVTGAHFDLFETELLEPIRFFGSNDGRPKFSPQLVFLHQRLRLLCSYSSKLRDIIGQKGNDAYKDILENLEILWGESDNRKWSAVHRRHLMERQLWRLQDMRDGGGFGFWVESFLLVATQVLSIPLPPDAQTSLILGLFRVVTSNWRQHKHSIGTQRVILNVICDIAVPGRGLLYYLTFPRYITDELLVLAENVLEGQSGSHIDEAMKELEDGIEGKGGVLDGVPHQWLMESRLFAAEAVKIISRSRAPEPTS